MHQCALVLANACRRPQQEPGKRMLQLSEVLMAHPEFESFAELVGAVREGARSERFFRMDIKPPYADTPGNWEDKLESAFNGVL